MKQLSFILVLLVLILSSTPYLTEDKCFEQCFQETENQDCDNENKACTDCCSPFLACNTCTGFVLSTNYTCWAVCVIQHPVKKIAYTSDIILSDFYYSIWHPPKCA